MFTSLNARLWLTYAIIILLILSILGLGIFVYIVRNPIIDRQAMQKLDVSLSLIQRQLKNRNLNIKPDEEYFTRISDSLSIRLLLIDSERNVYLDTEPENAAIMWQDNDQVPSPQGRINDREGSSECAGGRARVAAGRRRGPPQPGDRRSGWNRDGPPSRTPIVAICAVRTRMLHQRPKLSGKPLSFALSLFAASLFTVRSFVGGRGPEDAIIAAREAGNSHQSC